jgi:hypothetical protein
MTKETIVLIYLGVYVVGAIIAYFVSGIIEPQSESANGNVVLASIFWPVCLAVIGVCVPFLIMSDGREKLRHYIIARMEKKDKERPAPKPEPQPVSNIAENYRHMPCQTCGQVLK